MRGNYWFGVLALVVGTLLVRWSTGYDFWHAWALTAGIGLLAISVVLMVLDR